MCIWQEGTGSSRPRPRPEPKPDGAKVTIAESSSFRAIGSCLVSAKPATALIKVKHQGQAAETGSRQTGPTATGPV